MQSRTDLALEQKEFCERSATALEGVRSRTVEDFGVQTTIVEVLNKSGEKAIGKPRGTYLSMDLQAFCRKELDGFKNTARAIGLRLSQLMGLGERDKILVVGLGNEKITPDALGPKVLERLLITRHLIDQMPDVFDNYRATCAIAPNVLGVTGLESAEVVHGVASQIKPDCLVVVDALAARSMERVCTTVQIADTGICPGSGVHNSREAFNKERFGVPVYAVGVPTVVDVETILLDFCHQDNAGNEKARAMFVTPRDIDARVRDIAKLLAYGINLALHREISTEDIAFFVE